VKKKLSGLDTKPLVGQFSAWNYFQSVDTPENEAFIKAWGKRIQDSKSVRTTQWKRLTSFQNVGQTR